MFDTHLDLSEALDGDRLTCASPMLRASELENVDPRRMVVIGARGPRNLPEWTPLYRKLGMTVFPMEAFECEGIERITEKARAIATADGAHLHISVDIDSVDPAFAPGTNSPEPGGLTAREIFGVCELQRGTVSPASTSSRFHRISTQPAEPPPSSPRGS